jgi:hypothetical protein
VLRPSKLGGRIGVERLLAHLRQLVEVACLDHPTGQLVRCVGGLLDLLVVPDELLCGDGVEVGPARVCGNADRLVSGLQLGLRKPSLLDLGSEWKRQQAEDIEHDRALDFKDTAAFSQAAEAEAGVAEPAGSHQFRLGDSQLAETRLKAPVVQEGQLYRAIGGQWLSQDFCNACLNRVDLAEAALVRRGLPGPLPGEIGHPSSAPVRRK